MDLQKSEKMSGQLLSTLQTQLETTSFDDPNWINLKLEISNEFEAVWRTTGTVSNLNAAINALQDILDNTPGNHADRFYWHWATADLFYELHDVTETSTCLDLATRHVRASLEILPPGYPDLQSRIHELVRAYKAKPLAMPGADNTDMRLLLHQKALDLTPVDHPDHPGFLCDLGEAYSKKYTTTNQYGDLEKSILLYKRAFEMMPEAATLEDKETQAYQFESLSSSYKLKFDITQALPDLDAEIMWREKSILMIRDIPDCIPHHAMLLHSLSYSYGHRFAITNDVSDIDKSIRSCKNALSLRHDQLDRSELLARIGDCYESRFELTGAVTDAEWSIQYGEEALEMAAGDPYTRLEKLVSLSKLKCRSRKPHNALAELESTIRCLRNALNATPAWHPNRAGYVWDLGLYLQYRWHETGALADLDLSIQQLQEICSTCPYNGYFRHNVCLHLGLAYRDRHLRTGGGTDIHLAIEWCHKSLQASPNDALCRASSLMDLATYYADRCLHTNSVSDFDVAARWCQEALDIIPDHNHGRAKLLRQGGDIYHRRYKKTTAVADSDICIGLYEQALELIPEDHCDRHALLDKLGASYLQRYEDRRLAGDASRSIQYFEEALRTSQDDNPSRSRHFNGLHSVYKILYQDTGLREYLDMSIRNGQKAFDDIQSPTVERLSSGLILFSCLVHMEDWAVACQTAKTIMSLAPRITPRSLGTSDKQFRLGRYFDCGLAREAAAVSLLAYQSAFETIQLLELGRSIIIGSLGELRTDVSELRRQNPTLAKEYLCLRGQLDAPIIPDVSVNRHALAKEFDKTLAEIRNQPGFERFLLPVNEGELRTAADHGPVVIINASSSRCDALVIQKDSIQSLNLPRLNYDDIEIQTHNFSISTLRDISLFEWLWDTTAEPILDFLKLNETPKHHWPRIWWIPVGHLAKLPIHAAGYHGDGSGNTVLDRVISSYSSSVKALIHSRQTDSKAGLEKSARKAVLVGMETTPGQPWLGSVSREIRNVALICKEMQLPFVQPLTSREEVLLALRDCSIFHFAGHGRNMASDPSQSALLLSDGPLTVENVLDVNVHVQKPFLAYLSACGTGQMQPDEDVDEGLHLISAYQIAGFRHVVGSLCEVDDGICEEFALEVYRRIRDHGTSDRSVCEGLHHASRKLRDSWVSSCGIMEDSRRQRMGLKVATDLENESHRDSPLCKDDLRHSRTIVSCNSDVQPAHWAPYVHFGA